MFNVWLRHRASLFDNGDPRVAPLFLWHLVEEIEHRSSAYMIYDALVPDRWYRVRMVGAIFAHMLGCHTAIVRGFDRHVPLAERGVVASELALGWPELRTQLARGLRLTRRPEGEPAPAGQFAAVPRRELWRMVYRLIRSQDPRHSPEAEETPRFAAEWLAAYDHGRDVVDWYARSSTTLP